MLTCASRRRPDHQSRLQKGLEECDHQAEEVGAEAQQAGQLDGWQRGRRYVTMVPFYPMLTKQK